MIEYSPKVAVFVSFVWRSIGLIEEVLWSRHRRTYITFFSSVVSVETHFSDILYRALAVLLVEIVLTDHSVTLRMIRCLYDYSMPLIFVELSNVKLFSAGLGYCLILLDLVMLSERSLTKSLAIVKLSFVICVFSFLIFNHYLAFSQKLHLIHQLQEWLESVSDVNAHFVPLQVILIRRSVDAVKHTSHLL